MGKIIQNVLNLIASVIGGVNNPKAPKFNSKGQPTKAHDLHHIKKWESLRLEAYKPTPHDFWTIGWGHTGNVRPGMVITKTEAERLLRDDLTWVQKAIRELVHVPLSQKQYDALAGLIFNIGRTNFKKSTVLRRLNASDYEGAAEAMMMWTKQRQNGVLVELRGLVRRRKQEKEMFLDGTT